MGKTADSLRSLYGRLNLPGKVLLGLAGVMLVATAAVYAAVTFSGTRLDQYGDDTYTWESSSGSILIERVKSTESAVCGIEPESGERRSASAQRRADDPVKPWFDGSATVQCDRGSVKIYTGTMAMLRTWVRHTWVLAIPVVIPFVGALAVSGLVVSGKAKRR